MEYQVANPHGVYNPPIATVRREACWILKVIWYIPLLLLLVAHTRTYMCLLNAPRYSLVQGCGKSDQWLGRVVPGQFYFLRTSDTEGSPNCDGTCICYWIKIQYHYRRRERGVTNVIL